MNTPHKDLLDTFTLDALPDLDVVALGALELFSVQEPPHVDLQKYAHPLVVGSVNALSTGKMLFANSRAVFADESSLERILAQHADIDGAFVISASGSKHAIGVVETLLRLGIAVDLLTNTAEPSAGRDLPSECVHVLPRNREPYSYNTSTYLGMLLASTHEQPATILDFITQTTTSQIQDEILQRADAFTLILPPMYADIRDMLRVKFEELFGPKLVGRAFTSEEIKHAKTIVTSPTECFVAIGLENAHFGDADMRITLTLPDGASFATLMAVTYVLIGHIQRSKPPFFKERIQAYAREVSEMFKSDIDPIVE